MFGHYFNRLKSLTASAMLTVLLDFMKFSYQTKVSCWISVLDLPHYVFIRIIKK